MRLSKLFAEKPSRGIVRNLYTAAVRQARQVPFYVEYGVADTPDGRFDMVALHVILLLRRLKREHARTADEAQGLFDLMFADMDKNLREMGVGDVGVGRRIRGMAEAFYGRLHAYHAGLDAADHILDEALQRNLYRKTRVSTAQVAAMADYMRRNDAALAATPVEVLYAGSAPFIGPDGLDMTGVEHDRSPAS